MKRFALFKLPDFQCSYGEISQVSIKCTLLLGFELKLRPSFGRFQMERAFRIREAQDAKLPFPA